MYVCMYIAGPLHFFFSPLSFSLPTICVTLCRRISLIFFYSSNVSIYLINYPDDKKIIMHRNIITFSVNERSLTEPWGNLSLGGNFVEQLKHHRGTLTEECRGTHIRIITYRYFIISISFFVSLARSFYVISRAFSVRFLFSHTRTLVEENNK